MSDRSKHDSTADRFELDMSPDEFRQAGYELIDVLCELYASIADRPVTRAESVDEIRQIFPPTDLPEEGTAGHELLRHVAPLLIDHSLHNGHPRFLGYITSSAAPLGALGDLLASAINQNCVFRDVSPAANEIERQTIDWLAALIGFPRPCGGIMVSGGNVANMLGFFAARQARLPWSIRREGLTGFKQPVVYASRGTHTWLEKTVDIAGMGTDAIRWIATDRDHRLDIADLERLIEADASQDRQPFLVIGTAGNVSTGAIDPLPAVADIAEREGLWFHVDGAYGAPAAMLPDAPDELEGLTRADSVALDPHKWLYNPIEAACTLVRDPAALLKAFSYRPTYYQRERKPADSIDFYEHGFQNTRGFRALKTWLCIRQAGRQGYARRIGKDIELSRLLHRRVLASGDLEAGTQHLSITTFRYHPQDFEHRGSAEVLDKINLRALERLIASGDAFVSNAVLDGRLFLRACIVNFRTTAHDIDRLVADVVRAGREAEADILGRSARE